MGLILDRQLTWRSHIETVKVKCSKRLNLLRNPAGAQWRADQSTLLRVHKMLSPIGSGVRKCDSGVRKCGLWGLGRQENTIRKTGPHSQQGTTYCPWRLPFVRAKETCSMLEVDLKDVDQMVHPEYTPWITNMEVNIDTTMLAFLNTEKIV
jgi:hypothetical protein